ncbi:MAG: hypothetical protein ACKOWN_02235 [Microbacteriaceae bacterium]
MRFLSAIVLFVISLALFAGSLVIRHFFSDPDTLTQTIELTGEAPLIVIDGEELGRISVNHSVTATFTDGAEADLDVVVGRGRTLDLLAWVGSASYHFITVDDTTGELTDSLVSGLEPEVPSPSGSDLLVEEWDGIGTVTAPMIIDNDQSVIIASDGTNPAPSSITIIWNLAVDRTISTIMLYLAAASGFVGLVAFLWGLWRERRQRRHRQGRMPRAPKPPRWRPKRPGFLGAKPHEGRRGRRMLGMVAGVGLIPAILAGCAPAESVQPTPTPVETGDQPYVAMTAQQFQRILDSITGTLEAADEKRATNIAATRLQGAALRFREATYRVKGVSPDLGTLFTIPDGTVNLLLPQQTEGWPRSVFAIVDDTTSETAPSVAIILTQDGPRSNYHVDYTFALEPGVIMPEVPSTEFGTAVLPEDTQLLSASPAIVAEQYGDLLLRGKESDFAPLFVNDTLQEQIGAPAKSDRQTKMTGKAQFSWIESVTDDPPVVFATSDAGAMIAVTIRESEIVKPVKNGSAISTEGAVRVMSGRSSSLRGIQANYEYQLLMYVPPLGTTDQIKLLGYSYALVSANDLR